jgi:hypothetical protein
MPDLSLRGLNDDLRERMDDRQKLRE